jgi:precorrin-2 dehydrogenase/sirohydrochlorin ferrochelatase
MVDLRRKKAVVAGGGRVAGRKIRLLLKAGASVTVVSPEVVFEIERWNGDGRLVWEKRRISRGDLSDAFIIIAATGDERVNEQIGEWAYPRQLVNVVDQPELGNFHTASVFERGKLTVAVSTNGASPLLARKIRDELAEGFGDAFDEYLEFLYQCRERIKELDLPSGKKKQRLAELLDPKFRHAHHRRTYLSRWHDSETVGYKK